MSHPRRAHTAAAAERAERRLVVVVGAVVFVDTVFYAAITPLLPALAHSLRLSKLSAGVMTASYPLGTLLGSIPGGLLAVRVGPRRAVYAGLALLAASTLAFGWLNDAAALDAARLVEGLGGACSWAGGMAWIVAETAVKRRGARIGAALAAGIGGALFGPVVGTVADAAGRGPTFSGVVVCSVALMIAARGLELTHNASGQGVAQVLDALREPRILAGIWLVTLPAVASGLLNVLGPLRLHRFGATALAIGGTFLAAAGIEAAVSPAIGRLSDRRGRFVPVRFGLLGTGVLLACLTVPTGAAGLAVLIVLTATMLGAFWAPAMAMLSDAADDQGLDQALAAALMNLAWAAGQILGAGGGGAIAKAADDRVPTLIGAGLCFATLAAVSLRRTPA